MIFACYCSSGIHVWLVDLKFACVAECLKLTNLFYFISLRASLEPGSTLGEKGEKNRMGEKKELASEAS